MKFFLKSSLTLALMVAAFSVHAEDTTPSMNLKNMPLDQDKDTSITIHKGTPESDRPEFEILTNSDDISGDPSLDRNEAYSSWKSACTDWKKDVRDEQKDNQVVAPPNCGKAVLSKEQNGMKSYSSTGTYKVKVRIRTVPGQSK